MGVIDRYSIVHFIAGFIVYFLKINITSWFVLNAIFEIYENVSACRSVSKIVKEKFYISSGDPETLVNSIGDNFCSILGWICAYYIDKKYWHIINNAKLNLS